MARTRAQRRRHTLLITLALVFTLLVLLFARDVSRSAHGAADPRRSEDRSFAALANTLVTQENEFDSRLDRLLSQGSSLRRIVFAARLDQLNEQLPGWIVAADQLRRPALAHGVSETLYQVTQQRVAAYQTLLEDVARALALPWSGEPIASISDPSATLVATSEHWNLARYALVKEPGLAHLVATSAVSARYFQTNGSNALVHSSSLALVRAVSIAALRVSPAPLPAAAGILLLPPVTSVQLGVSVLNASYDEQPVSLTIRVTPLNGRGEAFAQTMSTTLGPTRAFAFVPKSLHTAASEQARVVVIVSGARAAQGQVTREVYRLTMSPSGNTKHG